MFFKPCIAVRGSEPHENLFRFGFWNEKRVVGRMRGDELVFLDFFVVSTSGSMTRLRI